MSKLMEPWRGVLAWVLLALCLPTGSSADSIGEKIDKERKSLEQLKDRIEEKRRQADEADKKRESILQGIDGMTEADWLTNALRSEEEQKERLRKEQGNTQP